MRNPRLQRSYLTENIAALLCHGVFSSPETAGNLQLVLSEPGGSYQCLDYRDREGVVEGRFLSSSCQTTNNIYVNISSTGPCILPLTAGENTGTSYSPPRYQACLQSILGFFILLVPSKQVSTFLAVTVFLFLFSGWVIDLKVSKLKLT